MRFRIIPFFVTLLSAVSVVDLSVSEAQHLRSRQPLQAGFRWLGQGWSAGYHHRNPGPNTDYYNPYTAHNSMLISKQPGHQTAQHQYHNHPTTPGVPYSVYAPTSGANTNWDYGHGQGKSIQPTFVPSEDSDDENSDDNETEESDNNPRNGSGGDFDTKDLDDMPNITSDPKEPGSIRVSEDMDDEDADFEESASDDDEFDDQKEADDASVNATRAGYSRQAPESLESMDFRSFMVN